MLPSNAPRKLSNFRSSALLLKCVSSVKKKKIQNELKKQKNVNIGVSCVFCIKLESKQSGFCTHTIIYAVAALCR